MISHKKKSIQSHHFNNNSNRNNINSHQEGFSKSSSNTDNIETSETTENTETTEQTKPVLTPKDYEQSISQSNNDNSEAKTAINHKTRLVNIVKHLAFYANNYEKLQFLGIITQQLLQAYEANRENTAFLDYVKTMCEKFIKESVASKSHIACYEILLQIIDLLNDDLEDKKIIDEIITNLNTEQAEEQNINAHSPKEPSDQPITHEKIKKVQHRYIETETPTSGELISHLAHRNKALRYANIIANHLYKQYLESNSILTFDQFIIEHCQSLTNNKYTLIDTRSNTSLNTCISTRGTKKAVKDINIPANELTPKTTVENTEIQKTLDIANSITSLYLHHDKNIDPAIQKPQHRSYYKENSWEIFEDFVIKNYDDEKDPRFSILYQLLVLAAQMRIEGWSNENILYHLQHLSIVESIPENTFTKTTETTQQKKSQKNNTIYTPDATRFLFIARNIEKKSNSSFLKSCEKVVTTALEDNSNDNLFQRIIMLTQKKICQSSLEKIDNQCIRKICELILVGHDDRQIITQIRDFCIKLLEQEIKHYQEPSSKESQTSHNTPIQQNKVKPFPVIEDKNIEELFSYCRRWSNCYLATKQDKLIIKVLQQDYNDYQSGKKAISFINFLKAQSGMDHKYDYQHEIIIKTLREIKNGLPVSFQIETIPQTPIHQDSKKDYTKSKISTSKTSIPPQNQTKNKKSKKKNNKNLSSINDARPRIVYEDDEQYLYLGDRLVIFSHSIRQLNQSIYIYQNREGLYGIIDINKKGNPILCPCQYTDVKISPDKNGLLVYKTEFKRPRYLTF